MGAEVRLGLAFISLFAPLIFNSVRWVKQLREQVVLGERDGVTD